MRCADCGKEGLLASQMNYEVKGYEKPRKQGGTNAIMARQRTGKAICDGCMVRRKSGFGPEQQGMF